MLLSYMWIGLDGMVGSLCGATIRASLRDANKVWLLPARVDIESLTSDK